MEPYFLLAIFFPSAIGFLFGMLLALCQTIRASIRYRAVKRDLADLIKGRETKLQSFVPEIIGVFAHRDFVVVERTKAQIVFAHPPLFDIDKERGFMSWLAFLTIGGSLAAELSFYLFNWLDQKVTFRLVP